MATLEHQRPGITGGNFVDLPHPGAVDSLEIARIARLHMTDEFDPQAAFWNELAEKMESIRVR
jgi:hypothetical protein